MINLSSDELLYLAALVASDEATWQDAQAGALRPDADIEKLHVTIAASRGLIPSVPQLLNRLMFERRPVPPAVGTEIVMVPMNVAEAKILMACFSSGLHLLEELNKGQGRLNPLFPFCCDLHADCVINAKGSLEELGKPGFSALVDRLHKLMDKGFPSTPIIIEHRDGSVEKRNYPGDPPPPPVPESRR